MRRWLVTGLLVVLLIALALTAAYWAPPLLQLADTRPDRIQALEALLQMVLVAGAGILAFVRWWRGKKKEPAVSAAAGKKGVAVGGDVHGNVTVIHSEAGPADAARLLSSIGNRLPPEAVRRATEQYLKQLFERFRYLEHKGMGVSDRLPLRLPLLEMFIPLKARIEAPEGETWERRIHLAGRPPTEEELGRRLSEPQPVLELLKSNDGLIVLGDPGSGKTTLLKFLALVFATGQGQALGLKPYLPVLLPLSSYAGFLEAGDLPLDDAIARHWQERGVEAPLAQMLEAGLAKGGVLLLLDGLDEIRDPQRRLLVVERVKDFYCAHRGAGNKFVLTSRIVGYREVRPEAEGLAEATLVDFDDDEIEEFVQRWTHAVEGAAFGGGTVSAAEAGEREKTELLEAIRRNPGVRSLAANPLLLTILALMKRQGVTLPERRVELYKTYIETLLKHWNEARSLSGRSGRDLDIAETMKILPPLALWMHETSPGVGLVKEMDVHRRLEEIYRERGHEDPERATRQFLEDVREHAALLLDRGGRQYGFIHLTFQEYLAAVALAQSGQKGVGPIADALVPHVGEPPWHEVILLTVGYLGILQQRDEVAGDLISALLDRQPGPPGEAVFLAGQAVADAGSGGVPPACRKRVVEELLVVIQDDVRVEPRRRALAGNALADLGDPRPEVTTLDGMEFCWVPQGAFQMGSEQQGDLKESPVHRCEVPYDYWIGRYPVTMGQLQELVGCTGFVLEYRGSLDERINLPAWGLTWDEAVSFCERLTKLWKELGRLPSGWSVRLPSEAEWEKAARGGEEIPIEPQVGRLPVAPGELLLRENGEGQRVYPWGDAADPNRANFGESAIDDVSGVGCFPSGSSPYGCEEMSGNVWEWTRSRVGDYPYPPPGSEREQREGTAGPDDFRVARGGSSFFSSGLVRCAGRYRFPAPYRSRHIGFRVVVSPFNSDR